MTTDHIIIGSGINALVAGALLARKGKKVQIFERSDRVGGCMRTEEMTLPGFKHDVMAATFVLFMTSPAYAELAEELANHGFELCHTDKPTAVIRPDGEALVLRTDPAANATQFNSVASGEGDQYQRDFDAIASDAEFLFALLGGNLWSKATAKLLARRVWKQGLRNTAAWFGQSLVSMRGWLEPNYRSELVQALWAPWVLHVGLTPEGSYGGMMGKVIAFALSAAGAPIAKGGASAAAEALASLIRANGGDIFLDADVDEIRVSNGRVVGITLADGSKHDAGSVLASVAPGQLYGRLLKQAAPEDKMMAEKFRHGRGNFQLHYALDAEPQWNNPDIAGVALTHLADGIDSVSKSANEAERGMLPATPTICVGQPAALDPSRCPEGKSILWLQIPDAPRVVKGDAAGLITTCGVWDEATREAYADRIENILKKHIGNFDAIKLKRVAYSPKDLESLNINLVGGDPYGGLCSLEQFFLWRPFADTRGAAAGPKGLMQIGASTHPGPGLGAGSGYIAAKSLGA